jgi:hypothetical protein
MTIRECNLDTCGRNGDSSPAKTLMGGDISPEAATISEVASTMQERMSIEVGKAGGKIGSSSYTTGIPRLYFERGGKALPGEFDTGTAAPPVLSKTFGMTMTEHKNCREECQFESRRYVAEE